MDPKKHRRYDLESKRGIYFQIGMVIALALVLGGFQWRVYSRGEADPGSYVPNSIPEEVIPLTHQEMPLPANPLPRLNNKPKSITMEVVDHVTVPGDLHTNVDVVGDDKGTDVTPADKTREANTVEPEIYTVVDEPPMFPGGEEARIKFIQNKILYPKFARENKIQGPVWVSFIIEKDGSVTHIRILRGIGAGCDDEALRMVQAMPGWIPGKKNGVPVRIQVNMSVNFTLQSSN